MWRYGSHSYILLCEAQMLLFTSVAQLLARLRGCFQCLLVLPSPFSLPGCLIHSCLQFSLTAINHQTALFSAILFARKALKQQIYSKVGEIRDLYFHRVAIFLLNSQVQNQSSRLPFWMLLQLAPPRWHGLLMCRAVGCFALLPRSSCSEARTQLFHARLDSPLDAIYLRHLLPFSTSFVSCSFL